MSCALFPMKSRSQYKDRSRFFNVIFSCCLLSLFSFSRIIPLVNAESPTIKASFTNYLYHDQIHALVRGGARRGDGASSSSQNADSSEEKFDDPLLAYQEDTEEGENVHQKSKLLKAGSSGWSFLKAFRMKEEAFIEMAGESENGGEKATTAFATNTPTTASTINSSKNTPSEILQKEIPQPTNDKSRRSTIVGGAGTTTKPSALASSKSHSTSTTLEENEMYSRIGQSSSSSDENNSRAAPTDENEELSKFRPGPVAAAASRLINEYIETETTDHTDFFDLHDETEYEEYEYDDEEDDQIDLNENISNSATAILKSKEIDEAQAELNSQSNVKYELRESPVNLSAVSSTASNYINSRKKNLETMVDKSEMLQIRQQIMNFSSSQSKASISPSSSSQDRPSRNTETPSPETSSAQLLLMPESKSPPMSTTTEMPSISAKVPSVDVKESAFVSSGYWNGIDKVMSFGLSSTYSSLRLSRQLRSIRKATAKVTGLHGFVSGKGRQFLPTTSTSPSSLSSKEEEEEPLNEEVLGVIRRRIAAIDDAKQRLGSRIASDYEGLWRGERILPKKVRGLSDNVNGNENVAATGRRGPFRLRRRKQQLRRSDGTDASMNKHFEEDETALTPSPMLTEAEMTIIEQEEAIKRQKRAIEVAEEIRRKARVQEIDRLILEGQNQMVELQCEKDFLQRRPNPLFNYTTTSEEPNSVNAESNGSGSGITSSREFNFPPTSLVEEYIEELKSTGRLVMLNHTNLWRSENENNDEDETIGDDLFTPSGDAEKLYRNDNNDRRHHQQHPRRRRHRNSNHGLGGGGSWVLRQTLGKGVTLGEKLGETLEIAAYQSVCTSVMGVLARSISAMHGVNVMQHSDIRLYLGQALDLPPVGEDLKESNYAKDTIRKAIQRGSKRNRVKNGKNHKSNIGDPSFIQRDAVVETLISHCQISAPLLKLFPLNWQRAILANIITLITAITSDFCAGMKFQILGYELSLSFKPITEHDIIRHIGRGTSFNHRRSKPEEFEAAVSATANDLSDKMRFLDRWHHRVLGSGMLRAQLGNLIARIVLTLVDDVLCGATMDLWSAQAGGPRVIAGLEYRVNNDENGEEA